MKQLYVDIKCILDIMESHNHRYSLRFETLESALDNSTRKVLAVDSNTSRPMTQQPFHVRKVQIDFQFYGIHWIFKAKQFFNNYHTSNENLLTIPTTYLSKEVVSYFQIMTRFDSFFSSLAFTHIACV